MVYLGPVSETFPVEGYRFLCPGAMSLFGGWVGFQFITTLYLQQLRG